MWERGEAFITFKMEEHIGLIALEHLCHELHIHVLDIDLLQSIVHHHDRFIEFHLWDVRDKLMSSSAALQCWLLFETGAGFAAARGGSPAGCYEMDPCSRCRTLPSSHKISHVLHARQSQAMQVSVPLQKPLGRYPEAPTRYWHANCRVGRVIVSQSSATLQRPEKLNMHIGIKIQRVIACKICPIFLRRIQTGFDGKTIDAV